VAVVGGTLWLEPAPDSLNPDLPRRAGGLVGERGVSVVWPRGAGLAWPARLRLVRMVHRHAMVGLPRLRALVRGLQLDESAVGPAKLASGHGDMGLAERCKGANRPTACAKVQR